MWLVRCKRALSKHDDSGIKRGTKQKVLLAKQRLYTCVIHASTFLCRPLQNNDVKMTRFKVFVESVNKAVFFACFLFQLERSPYQYSSWIMWSHCTSWTSWDNHEVLVTQITWIYVLKWRFRSCRRLDCLSFLVCYVHLSLRSNATTSVQSFCCRFSVV